VDEFNKLILVDRLLGTCLDPDRPRMRFIVKVSVNVAVRALQTRQIILVRLYYIRIFFRHDRVFILIQPAEAVVFKQRRIAEAVYDMASAANVFAQVIPVIEGSHILHTPQKQLTVIAFVDGFDVTDGFFINPDAVKEL
jgi:hypothetical protein